MKRYKAYATMEDISGRQWNVAIYSHYESEEEAADGAKKFASHYKSGFPSVVSTNIQPA